MITLAFSKDILQIKDIQNLKRSLEDFIHDQTFENYKKRGIVIGVSGGIDSSAVAAARHLPVTDLEKLDANSSAVALSRGATPC